MNAYYLLTKRPLRAYELHKKWLVERLSRAPQSTASRPRFIREESPAPRPASGARGRPFLRTKNSSQ